jgi:hypothetical protein
VLIHSLSSNQAPGSQHRCIFQASMCTVVLPPEEVILPTDNFTITLHHCISGEEQISLVDPQYLPWRHGELGCLARNGLGAWCRSKALSLCPP